MFFRDKVIQTCVSFAEQNVERSLGPVLGMQMERRVVVLSAEPADERESESLAEPEKKVTSSQIAGRPTFDLCTGWTWA
jgi:hypothetical protein